jgi:hypothetical protein
MRIYTIGGSQSKKVNNHLSIYGSLLIQNLMILFGNGVIGELRTEADSDNALLVLRWVMRSAGGCMQHELTESEKQNLLLYQNNHGCHLQEGDPPGYIFISPQPNPARFE